MITPLHCAN
uniref:Uncharacterized protein n=1 Tax=Anguilla anguilla TaxID=7936 RepID=A0A0E9R7K5_ANGAN